MASVLSSKYPVCPLKNDDIVILITDLEMLTLNEEFIKLSYQ
jgi:hypothetical protein